MAQTPLQAWTQTNVDGYVTDAELRSALVQFDSGDSRAALNDIAHFNDNRREPDVEPELTLETWRAGIAAALTERELSGPGTDGRGSNLDFGDEDEDREPTIDDMLDDQDYTWTAYKEHRGASGRSYVLAIDESSGGVAVVYELRDGDLISLATEEGERFGWARSVADHLDEVFQLADKSGVTLNVRDMGTGWDFTVATAGGAELGAGYMGLNRFAADRAPTFIIELSNGQRTVADVGDADLKFLDAEFNRLGAVAARESATLARSTVKEGEDWGFQVTLKRVDANHQQLPGEKVVLKATTPAELDEQAAKLAKLVSSKPLVALKDLAAEVAQAKTAGKGGVER